jgi:hypothetical protein
MKKEQSHHLKRKKTSIKTAVTFTVVFFCNYINRNFNL